MRRVMGADGDLEDGISVLVDGNAQLLQYQPYMVVMQHLQA
jgi:hypothetical protein